MTLSTLIACHSQAKDCDQYVEASDLVNIVSRSGFKVEDMWKIIRDVVYNYDVVALHCGANNLIHGDSVSEVLNKFQRLVGQIRHVHPEVKIVISGILPRGDNRFKDILVRQGYLDDINNRARNINKILIHICGRDSGLFL